MQIKVLKYDLPDIHLLNCNEDKGKHIIWIPDKVYAVIGISNKAEESLIAENIINDRIIVYKRPSGGESVVLTPKTLVISSVADSTQYKSPRECFTHNNKLIISSLETLGVKNLLYKGISDITIKDRKILGSAIYRPKGKIFYQAVLNVSEDTEIFNRYLQHPKKEPDYRMGRNHSDFVTSLSAEGYITDTKKIIQALNKTFK